MKRIAFLLCLFGVFSAQAHNVFEITVKNIVKTTAWGAGTVVTGYASYKIFEATKKSDEFGERVENTAKCVKIAIENSDYSNVFGNIGSAWKFANNSQPIYYAASGAMGFLSCLSALETLKYALKTVTFSH